MTAYQRKAMSVRAIQYRQLNEFVLAVLDLGFGITVTAIEAFLKGDKSYTIGPSVRVNDGMTGSCVSSDEWLVVLGDNESWEVLTSEEFWNKYEECGS